MTPALPGRIAAKIGPPDVNGCWPWLAYVRPDGYPEVSFGGRNRRAHRVIYRLLVGPIPDDRPVLDHVWLLGCRLKSCVNPVHLEPVTHIENQRRRAATVTQCPVGHPYDKVNTYRPKRGGRQCRACRAAVVARIRTRQREAA